jgi:hypothetical protein
MRLQSRLLDHQRRGDLAVRQAAGDERKHLTDATVIRALIVPAVITLMGRWNWWPAQPARATAEGGAVTADASGGEGIAAGRGTFCQPEGSAQ